MKHFQARLRELFSHSLIVMGLGICCCFLLLTYYFFAHKALGDMEGKALQLKKRHLMLQQRVTAEDKLQNQLKIADRDFVEKQLESLQFLAPEMQKLQAVLLSQPEHHVSIERLNFLQADKNRLRFNHLQGGRSDHFQEVELIAEHPVEMNQEDLKLLLARIENIQIGETKPGNNPPDLWIKKFELIKKPLASNEETYRVHLELIKRELAL